ncbi:MAG: EF-hand domain-containing protein [Floccifex porci]|uniref:EF-hand domain-containing protein n=1 Tax=Floccifex porci TaxID=2606629 RepID=UPI003068B1C8|nr:EF-hand domain-containing protein [Anaerostipes sp.]
MNGKWKKPELIVETFQLSQHIAAGCTHKPGEVPDFPDIPVEDNAKIKLGCQGYTGKGHYAEVILDSSYDKDGSGDIDWNEFVAAVEHARNNVMTGSGHRNHNIQVLDPPPGYDPGIVVFNS